jgi:retinol dehydrogenase 12
MEDTIAVVTGGNRGIGKETAIGLAKMGYTVIMACRDQASGEAACAEIRDITGNERVYAMKLDVSAKSSIRDFVGNLVGRFGKINILVNNAGISSSQKKKTVDGIEINIGTNYFGTFLLTYYLLPYFEKGVDNRIVNLTSNIYVNGPFKLGKINSYRWVKAYAVSKYMILLFTLKLADYLRDTTIKVNAAHPGIVRTGIMYNKKWYDSIIKLMLQPFFIDPREGARTSLYLASSPGLGDSGGYYAKCKKQRIPKRLIDEAAQNELWDYSVKYAEGKA